MVVRYNIHTTTKLKIYHFFIDFEYISNEMNHPQELDNMEFYKFFHAMRINFPGIMASTRIKRATSQSISKYKRLLKSYNEWYDIEKNLFSEHTEEIEI